LIALAVLFVGGVAGWRFYESQAFQERAALGASFEAAISEVNAEKKDAVAPD